MPKIRKAIAVLLIVAFIIPMLPITKAYAAANVSMENGEIYFNTTSKKASGGTRYKTVGWTVTRNPTYGDPTTTSYGKMLNMTQDDEIDNGDGTVTTYFSVSEAAVTKALLDAKMPDIKPGDTIYLNSVFVVTENGVEQDPLYYTKAGISGARGWANKGDFDQYYDIRVHFDPIKYKVQFVQMKEDGSWFSYEDLPTKYYPGDEIKYDIPTSSGSLKLVKSYLENLVSGDDYFPVASGPSLSHRDFTQDVGGMRIVGVYAEPPPPTSDPYVFATATVDPTSVQFNGSDIKVTINVSAQLKNYSGSTSDIRKWVIFARKDQVPAGEEDLQDPADYSSKLSVSHRFTFTISASELSNVDSYIEHFIVRPRVYLSDTEYYDTLVDNLQTKVYKSAPPPPTTCGSVTLSGPSNAPPGSVTFRANTSGWTPERFNWYKDGSLVDSGFSNSASISFSSVGTYDVSVRAYCSSTQYTDDETSITIAKANSAPVAIINTSQTNVRKGGTISVDGWDSYDPDGDSLMYFWSVSPSTGWSGSLTGPGGGSITINESGSYDIQLIVTDGDLGDVDTATVGAMNSPPTAFLSMPSSIFQGGTATLNGSYSYDPDGDPLSYSWSIIPSSGWSGRLSGSSPDIRFSREGTYTVNLTVNDGEATDSEFGTIEVKNSPPVAAINIPSYIEQGKDIVIESNSYDPDEYAGDSISFDWTLKFINADGTKTTVTPSKELKGTDQDLTKETNNVWFDKYGNYELTLYVEDSWGKSDSKTITFEVKPAIPTAQFDFYDSYYKQNRLVQIDGTSSTGSERYPVDFSKTEWQYVPPSGVSSSQAKVESSTDLSKRRLIFKEPGTWKVRMRVTNTAGNPSEWFERQVAISPDSNPNVDFKVDSTVTRDANNNKKATIRLTDLTSSPDWDNISKRVWTYKFDSDNDGDFVDETWVTLSTGNNKYPVLYTDKVGNYMFELYAEESFGQPTLSQFINSGDLRKGDTSFKLASQKETEVINLKPVVSFSPILKKKVDLVMTVGQVDKTKVADLNGMINTQMVTKFAANGIDAQISSVETTALSMQNTFQWQEYTHNYTDSAYHGATSEGAWTSNHIVKNNGGKTITFYGYDSPAYHDFLFLPDEQQSKKTFTFDVSEDSTVWHALEGSGYLFNAKIKNGILSGYAILLAQANVQLWEINGVNVNSFHEGSIRTMSSAGTLIGSFPKNGTQHKIVIEATPDQVDMWDNDVKIIDAQKLNNQYGNGFGPMAAYFSHGCNQLSYITFKNITMETTTGKSFDEVVKEPTWRDNSSRFIANINDVELPEFNDPSKTPIIYSRLLNDNIDLSILGTSANQAQANKIISTNDGHGMWHSNADMNKALSDYADYIISLVNQRSQLKSQYILLNQEIDYTTSYSDAENDPEIDRRWRFDHTNPYYFQNSLGAAPFSGQWLPEPITKFSYVGEFTGTFQAKDEPRQANGTFDPRFGNYREWSLEANPVKLYVHRKPIAMYTAALSKANAYDYNLAVSDTSYDLDHQYESSKGIVQREWKWKYSDATGWTNGMPPTYIQGGKTVTIYLRVKDKEGAWSDPEVRVMTTTGNMAPVANFSFIPNPLPLAKALSYSDFSYDPNSDPIISYHWRSQPASGGSWTDHGSSSGTNFDATAPKRFGAIGDYRIELTVTDSQGAVSDPFYQVVKVIPDNRKPIAKFTISPGCAVPQDVAISYTDQSSDPDGDPLVAWEWRYKKSTSSTWTYVSSPPTDLSGLSPGNYQIELRVKDNPPLPQLDPLWSDWYTSCGGTFKVLPANQKPVANLVLSPNPVASDEPLTSIDKSTDPEGKPLQAYELQITQLESGVSKTFTKTYSKASGDSYDISDQSIRIFETSGFPNDGAGTYQIKYRVKDTSPNGMSPELWSDWQIQTLIIEDPLSIVGAVYPPVARSGEAITLKASTEGKAEEVVAYIDWNQDGDTNDQSEKVYLSAKYGVSSKLNDWSASVIIPLPTKDGTYRINFVAKKTSPWDGSVKVVNDNTNVVTVRGDIFDDFIMEYYD